MPILLVELFKSFPSSKRCRCTATE